MRIRTLTTRRLYHTLLPVFFSLLLALIQVPPLYAQDASIKDLTVSNSESQLILYLTVSDCFTDEMIDAIHNGIPATFTYYVDIYRKRSAWPDKKIRKYEFNHVMTYDSLKKEYLIKRDEKGDSRLTASLDEAKRLMAEINGFRIMPLDDISPRAPYIIRVKAKLARKTLPLYFHYLIPFTSLWDFETDWHELTMQLAL